MSQNYTVSQTGFKVEDQSSGHIMIVEYSNESYQGVVIIPEENEQLPLAPWKKGENPFQDDNGFIEQHADAGPYGSCWFVIEPSSPFSNIMSEVEGFNNKLFKPKSHGEIKLEDIAIRKNNTGYMFADIMNDLGGSAEDIMNHSKSIQMAYAYARRVAATALYFQGMVDLESLNHNITMFKAFQVRTESSPEFQEDSFSKAIEYMQTYNPIITRTLMQKMGAMVNEFEATGELFNDDELIADILDI